MRNVRKKHNIHTSVLWGVHHLKQLEGEPVLDAVGPPPANLDHGEVAAEIEKHTKILDAHGCRKTRDQIENVVVVHNVK